MIEIIPVADIKIDGIKILRRFSAFPISEIKEAAKNGNPVVSIEEFDGEWESNRILLRDLATIYLNTRGAVFRVQVTEAESDFTSLAPEEFIESLKGLRDTELEAQRNTDLECGYISDPSEFVPHDEDWTLTRVSI